MLQDTRDKLWALLGVFQIASGVNQENAWLILLGALVVAVAMIPRKHWRA